MGIRSFVCALTVWSVTALAPLSADAQVTTVTFYETLSPYGDWVVVENYGRVWRPSRTVVGVDFVPYASGGRWVHSNVGWVFEPTYEWGWLPFHYGRWYQDPFNGWVWVPDNVWAPAWVEWRVGGGYIGWAPSAPRYHRHVQTNWYFVENRRFVEPQVWQHRAVAVNSESVYRATRPIAPPSGQAWAPGPRFNEVKAASPIPVPERQIAGPPRQPFQVFPKEMPAAAPPPPSPMGMQKLQPVDRAPPVPGPQQPFGRDPVRAPPAPTPQPMEPFRQDPVRAPPPVQRDPQPFQRAPAPQPMQREPFQRPPQEAPPVQREPFQRAPPPMQQQPQPFQRAPAPTPQAAPQPMQREPQPMAPMPAPQQQQQPQPAPGRKQGPGPGQPFAPMGGPQRGGPPVGPPPGGSR